MARPTTSITQDQRIPIQTLTLLTAMSETTPSPFFYFYRIINGSQYLGPISWGNMTPLLLSSWDKTLSNKIYNRNCIECTWNFTIKKLPIMYKIL